MQLSLQNFSTAVNNFASAVQGACASLVDFSVGSVLRSVAEANAGLMLWLQWLILQVLSVTRAATSNGSDLDSWMADYGLTRLPATYATGAVTFSRFTPASAALILPGAQVKTADGSQAFTVVADTTQSAWNATLGGYVIGAGVASANASVVAVNAGTQANVQAGAITLLASATPFVDTVTNGSNFTTALDTETDAAFRARFSNYIQTRSLATPNAVKAAVYNVQQGLQCTVYENTVPAGGWVPGSFVAVVDDGSGNPSSTLLAACAAAVSTVRPAGSVAAVIGPSDTTVTVALTITTNPVGNKPGLLAQVQAAIVAYVNALPDGAMLPYSRLAGVAYAVDPSIVDVTGVLLNGGTADVAPASTFGVVKTNTGSVAVS